MPLNAQALRMAVLSTLPSTFLNDLLLWCSFVSMLLFCCFQCVPESCFASCAMQVLRAVAGPLRQTDASVPFFPQQVHRVKGACVAPCFFISGTEAPALHLVCGSPAGGAGSQGGVPAADADRAPGTDE